MASLLAGESRASDAGAGHLGEHYFLDLGAVQPCFRPGLEFLTFCW